MSVATFLVGLCFLAVVIGAIGFSAHRIRTWWVSCSSPVGCLADAVLALGLLTVLLELVGTVGQFNRIAIVVVALVAAAAAWRFVPDRAGDPARTEQPEARFGRGGALVSLGVAVLVVAQWSSRAWLSYRNGVADEDAMLYHLPVAARFVQSGSTTELALIAPSPVQAFHAHGVELLHALGMHAFRGDLLSPAVNVGFLLLGLLAGWCAGARWGVAPLTLGAVAIIFSIPVMAATAGTAASDPAATALLLAAVALVCAAEPRLWALAALAAGLAIGSKENAVVLAGALMLVMVIGAGAGRRVRIAGHAAVAVFLGGGYWFIRNWVRTGNPVPSMELGFGPLQFPSPRLASMDLDHRVTEYLTNGTVVRDVFVPGLRLAFGRGGLLFGAIVLVGTVLAFMKPGLPRGLAVVGLAGLLAYLITPLTAYGPVGRPSGFHFTINLRYVLPSVAVLAVAGCLAAAAASDQVVRIALGVVALMVVVNETANETASGILSPWVLGTKARAALVVGTALAAAAFAGWRRVRRGDVRAGSLAAAGLLVIAAGPVFGTRYLDRRYGPHAPTDPVVAAAGRDLDDARIGVAAVYLAYPLYGPGLSNHVTYVGRPLPHGGLTDIDSCPEWRRALNGSELDYVVIGSDAPATASSAELLADEWTSSAGGVTVLQRSDATVVYRIDQVLDPSTCRS